ncbi:MAG: hypothetical protein IK044_05585 [Methanobrevibacter sp.]|nr:hypothetical protein [Methanobrevibacter sp.]
MNIKNILLVIAIILVVAGTFMFLMAHQAHPKQDTKIMMTSADNITEGDNITVKLTDANNTPLTNQNLNVSIVGGSGESVLKSLTTDGNGEATVETDNSTTGSCALVVKYGGNDEFDGCNFTDNVVINKKVVKVKTNLTNTSSNYSTYTVSSNSSGNLFSYFGDDIITVEDYT